MNSRTLAAYGLAATMIGGSLVGAATVLTDDASVTSTGVEVIQPVADQEPATVISIDEPPATVAPPPSTAPAEAPLRAGQAGQYVDDDEEVDEEAGDDDEAYETAGGGEHDD